MTKNQINLSLELAGTRIIIFIQFKIIIFKSNIFRKSAIFNKFYSHTHNLYTELPYLIISRCTLEQYTKYQNTITLKNKKMMCIKPSVRMTLKYGRN